jgi:hypothetical protein
MEYYYSDGSTKYGPFTYEQLQAKHLAPGTLVWHDNLPDWTRLVDLPEFRTRQELPKAPPPLPAYSTVATTRTPLGEEEPTGFAGLVRRYRWVLVWCAFHAIALILSTNEIKYFNTAGAPKMDKFWPFVKYTEAYFTKVSKDNELPEVWQTQIKFNGFFTQYDWTEFSFYAGSALFLVVLIYVYRRTN